MSYLDQSDVYRRKNSIEVYAYITAHSTHTQLLLHEILARHKEANVSTLKLFILDSKSLKLYYRALEKVIAQVATDLEMREIMLDSITEVDDDDNKIAFKGHVENLPDESIRTSFYAMVLSGIYSVCSYFRNTTERITNAGIDVGREIAIEAVRTIGHTARTFVTVIGDLIPIAVVTLLSSGGNALLTLMTSVLELISIEQILFYIAMWYLSGQVIPWLTRTFQATLRNIGQRAIRNIIGDNNIARIYDRLQPPEELPYIGRYRLADELEEIEVDVDAIEFRYIEQINNALIPGQQLRLEHIEAFEEEIADDILVHVDLPPMMNLNGIDIEMYVGQAVDDGVGLGFGNEDVELGMLEEGVELEEALLLEEALPLVLEEALPLVDAFLAITATVGTIFTIAFVFGFVIYEMIQSHQHRLLVIAEISRQNSVYEDHITHLFKLLALDVKEYKFPYMSGQFVYGFAGLKKEIYTWSQKDIMGEVFLNYMMWRVGQTLKHGIIFTSPSIQEAIDFCNKLWMKYISPGVPFLVFDLDSNYMDFPSEIYRDYKGTKRLPNPTDYKVFISSYTLIIQDRTTRNQQACIGELEVWMKNVHKRAPLANGLLYNSKKSWSNEVARSVTIQHASSIEEFQSKPDFIDQNTISYLKKFVSLPKLPKMDRDKMKHYEIVEKQVDISKVFRLTTSAYTFSQIGLSNVTENVTKELFHAVQLPDCAVYVSGTRMILSIPENKIVVIGPPYINYTIPSFQVATIQQGGTMLEYIVSRDMMWSPSPYTVLHFQHYVITADEHGLVEWRDIDKHTFTESLFVENPFMWVKYAFDHPDRWGMVPNTTHQVDRVNDIQHLLQLIQAIEVPTDFEAIRINYNYGEISRIEEEDNSIVIDKTPYFEFNMSNWNISQYFFGPIHLIELTISGIVMLFQKPGKDIISNKVIILGLGSALSSIIPITTVFMMSMQDASFHRTTIPVKLRIGSIMSVMYTLSTTIPSAIMSLPSKTMYIVKSPIGVFLYDNSFKLTSGIMKVMVRYPKSTAVIAYVFSSSTRREDAAIVGTALLAITDTAVHGGAELVDYVVHTGESVVHKVNEIFGQAMSGYMILTIIGLAISFEMDRRKRAPKRKR